MFKNQGYFFVNIFQTGTSFKIPKRVSILGHDPRVREAKAQPPSEEETLGKRKRSADDGEEDDAVNDVPAPEPRMSRKPKNELAKREEKKEKKAMDNFLGLGKNNGNKPASSKQERKKSG